MKERGILMSAPMDLASLDDSKTQTRRAVRKQFSDDADVVEVSATTPEGWQTSGHSGLWWDDAGASLEDAIRCPYGIPGDRLWVRETFYAYGRWVTQFNAKKARDEWHFIDMTLECGKAYVYAASGAPHDFKKGNQRGGITPSWWKRPAIFMPRAASRLTLEIISVRVERLQSTSEADAVAEGVRISSKARRSDACYGIYECLMPDGKTHFNDSAYSLYRTLWEQINGPDSWDANPWVWVVEFKRIPS